MKLVNLDESTRKFMLQEVEDDASAGRLYFSRRLSEKGKSDYLGLLREAIAQHDPEWLADQLNAQGRLTAIEASRSKKGTPYIKRTPFGDHQTLAFGEFNRFYIRGVCARALAEEVSQVEVYRALDVFQERPQSESLIGQRIDPTTLLSDLRENVGRETRLGIPGGPNSGISVKLV